MNFDVFRKMNPPPPPSLNNETVRVWHGWINIGDKEVAREAAAKGLHVNLAITFLSLRKKLDHDNAQTWFKEEVVKWVHELLERKQIFKASHVLNNVGIDAGREFSKIFYTTTDKETRDYIGNHLLKVGQLEEGLQHLWTFVNSVLENEDLLSEYNLSEKSIQCLDNFTDMVKSEIAVLLLFKTEDTRLNKFVQGETLWKHLLRHNDLHNLSLWINKRFQSNTEDSKDGNLPNLFKRFHITNNMIELVASKELNVSVNVRNEILDELSQFGIIHNEEKNNLISVLQRFRNSYSLSNLYSILETNHSTLSTNNFLELLIDYCLEKKLYNVVNTCLRDFNIPPTRKGDQIQLINKFRELVKNFNETLLSDNIFHVSNILSDDIVNYFSTNPVTFLSFLFFSNEVNIVKKILTNESLTIKNVAMDDCLKNMMKDFKIFNEIVLHSLNGFPKCSINFYDLITRHLGVDSKLLFEFRFQGDQLYNQDLVKHYRYCKTVDYKFYLKESRPSVGAKLLQNSFTENDAKKIEKMAVENFNCDEISSSCVSLSEMVGVDSMKIRVLCKAARILEQSGYDYQCILELFLGRESEPYNVQKILETLLMEKIKSNSFLSSSELIEALQTYEIVIQFSKVNSLKLPELFLRCCASRNLWLPFLLVAQIHEYPLDQIKLLIQFFKSPNMLEHLTHGVVNDIQIEEKNILIRDRDSRKYLLSKVGVRKSVDALNQFSSSIKSQSSRESEGSSSSSDLFEIDVSNIKATLLQTLIRCHNSTDPPRALLQASQLYRNPLLAVLATSYEPDSLVTNWLTWLSVSCELCKVFTNYESTALSANAVVSLLEKCLKNRYPRTILESFEIFMPENPLKTFLEFLNSCYRLDFNHSALTQKLDTFATLMKNSRKNSIIPETDHEMTYLNSRLWIEIAATKLLASLLEYNCNSLYEQILIVENLCKIKVWTFFSTEQPNFTNLLSILKALHDSNSGVRINIKILFDPKNSRQAIVSCINELLDKQQYKVALQVARIENLPPDLILVKEWQNNMNDRRDNNFWNTCNETFIKHKVTADCVVDFYLDCSERLTDLLEKFTLLKLSWEWSTKFDLTCRYELEKKMWLSFLYLDEKHKNLNMFDIKSSTYLYRDLIDQLQKISPFEEEMNTDFVSQLERIVAHILNKSNFWLALKIQKMFNCKSTDLETLKLCHSLAEGILLPYQLNAEQRLLLSNVSCLKTYSHRRTYLSTKFSSFSSSSHSPANSSHMQTVLESVESYMNDTLSILKLLSEQLHNGTEIGQNIFMNYRISINIEVPYQVVVMTADYMKMLKDALEDNCLNKLDVVHDFIFVYKWSKHEVADFICEELTNAVISYTNLNLDHLVMWDLSLDENFQQILQLLQENCSLLGYKIYSYASTLHRSQIESTHSVKLSDISLVIELLIRAHDCFTADCNMEGISIILKKCKEVVSNLLLLQDWRLMVRLLTGVARYTEMNYVFQILKENDQFEYLLRKGFQKDNTLKVALLEYLQRYCPDNKDLYKIVALHFALFSEVALLWEREAQNVIKNLISISELEMQNNKMAVEEEPFILLQNNESTKICLNKAMENYIHATDFHLQGEKLTNATNSAKQAELIALQLGFLNEVQPKQSIVCLLNLKKPQIASLISSKLNFEQSWLLAEAYNFQVDWATVLYEQYVANNNLPFLEGFLRHLPLTDTLVHDISRKFIVSNITSVTQVKCMKNILNKLSSLYMKYRIASELGFTDLVEDLIVSGQLVYLKDTVWKKGYKN